MNILRLVLFHTIDITRRLLIITALKYRLFILKFKYIFQIHTRDIATFIKKTNETLHKLDTKKKFLKARITQEPHIRSPQKWTHVSRGNMYVLVHLMISQFFIHISSLLYIPKIPAVSIVKIYLFLEENNICHFLIIFCESIHEFFLYSIVIIM